MLSGKMFKLLNRMQNSTL